MGRKALTVLERALEMMIDRGYDPYNSADRIERVTLRSEDCLEFELCSESDANRALAEGKK